MLEKTQRSFKLTIGSNAFDVNEEDCISRAGTMEHDFNTTSTKFRAHIEEQDKMDWDQLTKFLAWLKDNKGIELMVDDEEGSEIKSGKIQWRHIIASDLMDSFDEYDKS